MSLTLPAPVTDPPSRGGLQDGADRSADPDLVDFAAHANSRLRERDGALYTLLARESARQRDTLMMVAASSVADPSVLACEGSALGNLTAEGYPATATTPAAGSPTRSNASRSHGPAPPSGRRTRSCSRTPAPRRTWP